MARIVYAGDSTVTFNKIATYPQMGLSQGLLLYLKDDVVMRSFAINGRSTKSFIDQGRLQQVDDYLEKDDFLFIQFGHNDEKQSDAARYAEAFTDYKDNLKKFIAVARKHEARPVLLTSIARRMFDVDGTFLPGSHGDYPEAVRQVAKEENVPCIDMTALTENYLSAVGDFASRALYVFPKDNTHLVMQGAMVYAGFLADGLRELGHPYVDLLVARDARTVDEDGQLSADPYMPLGKIGKLETISDNIDAAFVDETED
ncbi:MAG: rhamnogalacturonan acetylesterase [Lachnospiraceae bacterium]|nr:rhamnogalacturonan acetylesterase [Lachnospiraceae bacterium]